MKTLLRPDYWAEKQQLKVDGRPFDLAGREYIIDVIRDVSQKIVVKKAAQTAFTITFLVRTFHWITERGWHHMYLLPAKTGAIPFVQKRVDPIIASNEILAQKFKSVDNRTHKQTQEDIALLIRGTNVESELQETPVDVVIFDEFDRMVQEFLSDAKHRTDGSKVKRLTYLSTPSVPGHGIDSDDMWWESDQRKWEVPCPHCGRFQFFTLEENVKIGENRYDCAFECSHCSKEIPDNARAALNKVGQWVPHNLQGNFVGYQVNQFSSPTMGLIDIMEDYFLGQSDAHKLKSFFNQSLGEPYSAAGDQITPVILDNCRVKGFQIGGIPNGPVYIGIDVGHDEIYVIAHTINRFGQLQLWGMWHFLDAERDAWEQLEARVLTKIGTWVAVCDAHPDKRGAQALAKKYPGKFWMGFEKDRPNQSETCVFSRVKHGEAGEVTIDRTLAFDTLIHRMLEGQYILPMDARTIGEHMPRRDYNGYYSHMIQMVRVEEADAKGIVVARWVKSRSADHWHHATMFSLAATFGKPVLRVPANLGRAMRKGGNLAAA